MTAGVSESRFCDEVGTCLRKKTDPSSTFVSEGLDVFFCLVTEFWSKRFPVGPDDAKPSVLVQ